jgi:hypothetical protein
LLGGLARARWSLRDARHAGRVGRDIAHAGEWRDGAARLLLDVGPGGEAALLRLPSSVTALINGGPDSTGLSAALASRLPFYQRTLDLIVLTDPRVGDARGLEDAAGRFSVAQAADAGMLHPTSEYIAWLDALTAHGATRMQ